MSNFIHEAMLRDYFLMEIILKKHCSKLDVFKALGNIYRIDDGNNELFAVATGKTVSEIRSLSEYSCYTRIKNYKDMVGEASPFSEAVDAVATIKGEAITTAAKNNLNVETEQSVSAIYTALSEEANKGSVIALKVLGILRSEGLVFDKNLKEGVKNLSKAAKWCDKTAVLAMLRYDESARKSYISKLRAIVKDTPYEQLYYTCSAYYNVQAEEDGEEVALINKIFARGFIKRETFDSAYAKLIYSPAITIKDKRRILFSGDNALVSETCALPLKTEASGIDVDVKALTDLPVSRAKELSGIRKAFKSVDLRGKRAYRPLCISCASDYLAERIVRVLDSCFKGANVIITDAYSLREYDLEPTKNNVFVRMLDENKTNVVIIVLRGNVHEAVLDAIIDFLHSDKRQAFALLKPAVTLNISDVLPIVVCDAYNLAYMNDVCDVIRIADVKQSEKPAVIREIADRTGAYYGVDGVSVEEAAEKKLCALTPERIEKIIDDVVREERFNGKKVVVTERSVDQRTGSSSGGNKYGFNA